MFFVTTFILYSNPYPVGKIRKTSPRLKLKLNSSTVIVLLILPTGYLGGKIEKRDCVNFMREIYGGNYMVFIYLFL